MKKIGRIYGEAKINMREMIGNRENTTEPLTIKRQTKNIEDIRTYLKEISSRMQKQSKTNLLSIEENEQVGTGFDEYGVKLKEEGDFTALGDVFVQLASFHQSIETLRQQMDTALQAKVATPFSDFVSNDVRRARNEKLKYDKARVSYDALHNKAKQMKKKGSIDKIVEVEREVEEYKLVYEDIALETEQVQSDVCDMHEFQTLERLVDYITIYEDFFTQGLHLAKQISKDVPTYKNTIKELKEDFKEKKRQRGDADDEPGANSVFGIPLEDLLARENRPSGLPHIMEHAFHYIYKNSLKVEGIFRVSGSQKEVQELKKQIGRGFIDFSNVLNDHNVTGVLKLFLRELPAPLFPFTLYTPIVKCVQEYAAKDEATCVNQMRVLIDTLPHTHKTAIRYLFGMCHKVASNSSQNLMTPRNLAVVLAPNVLYSQEVSIEAVADSNGAVEFMIAHYEKLFPGSFADLMAALPEPVPITPPPSGTGTLRRPPQVSDGVTASPGVTAGANRMAISSPAPSASGAAPSPARPTANNTPKQRPTTIRGSSMYQLGQMEDEYSNLRKTPSEEHISAGETSPRGNTTPPGQPIVTPTYVPGQYPQAVTTPGYPPGTGGTQVTTPSYAPGTGGTQVVTPGYPPGSSPSVAARPAMPVPGKNAAISPGPKQLPPRPTTAKAPPVPSPLPPPLSGSGSLPPPILPPAPASSAPPPAHTTRIVLGSGLPPRTTSSNDLQPNLGYLPPPPSLTTPPLKSSSGTRPPQDDLIQF